MPTDLTEATKKQGFKIGDVVALKNKPSEQCTIMSISHEITVKQAADDEIVVMDLPKFMANYGKYSEMWYPIVDANLHDGYQMFGKKAAVAMALCTLSMADDKPAFTCMSKPLKKVISNANFKAG